MGIDRGGKEQGAPDKGFGRTGQGGTRGESHGEDVGFTIADPEDRVDDDVVTGAEPAGQGDDDDVGELRPPSPSGGAGSGSGPGTG